jgi:hypothetical protein
MNCEMKKILRERWVFRSQLLAIARFAPKPIHGSTSDMPFDLRQLRAVCNRIRGLAQASRHSPMGISVLAVQAQRGDVSRCASRSALFHDHARDRSSRNRRM